MNIAIIGTGYVGLVTGTCLSETGNQVICVDIDEKKIQQLSQGIIPIHEPGLSSLVDRNFRNGHLTFSTDLAAAVHASDIVFLALPTPPSEDGSADLSHVLKVTEQLANLIDKYTVIVTKSTVPVGTGDQIEDILNQHLSSKYFDVVSNPEFLREGSAVGDFMKPDRVVVGTSATKAQNLMRKLYAPFVRQNNPILCMDRRSAEITKYAANCYLATRISFMNEVANLCDKVGANVDNVRRGIGSDTRIGKSFLYPGIGYGGSCFPKDVKAMERTAREYGYDFKILNASETVNKTQRTLVMKALRNTLDNELRGKTIALWGLAFKPNTDDIREAPAIDIVSELLEEGAVIQVFDPEAMDNVKEVFGDSINYCCNQYDTLKNASALVIATEWNMFRTPDYNTMRETMLSPNIFDGRNLYDPQDMHDRGFKYISVGRPFTPKTNTSYRLQAKVRATG